MANRSQRHPVRYENQAGCIWGFISIFDYRNGRSTGKLLSDRKPPSREVVGTGNSGSELLMLTNSIESSQEIYDHEQRNTVMTDAAKVSVKELMEEEMFGEQDQTQTSIAKVEAKDSDSERKGRKRKNRKRTSKTSKSSCDIQCELDSVGKVGSKDVCHQDSEDRSSKNLDLEVIANELHQHIYQRSTSCVKCDWNDDLDMQSEQKYSEFERKLRQAIKVFIDKRFTDGKHLTENGKTNLSEEFTDALKTLSSNKELFLDILKDPNSLLVKQFEDTDDAQLEKDQNSNSSARSSLLVGELNNSKPSVPAPLKRHNFFRRRSKSQEKIPLDGDENYQTSSRIVILKPGPAGVQVSETEGKPSSSLQSHHSLGTKVQTERTASQFSFTEIKRKLKHVMGKERHVLPSNGATYRLPCERQNSGNSDKGIGREKGGWKSPNRDHFYNERFARPAVGMKNKDQSCKPKDTETSMGNETVEYSSQQRLPSIYIEAKKHLSEMLSNENEFDDFSSRRRPKTLGRLLSFPEFSFSPICSPGRDSEHGFVTAQQRLSPGNSFNMVNEASSQVIEENHVSHPGPSRQNLESKSSISDNPEDKVQSLDSKSDILDAPNHDSTVEETLRSMRTENTSEGDEAIVQTTDALTQEESQPLDISAECCSFLIIRDNQNSDLAEVHVREEDAQCLKLDSFEQDHLQSSPLTSPPKSSIPEHAGDVDGASERPERPSPVSVLEPLFTEDDISPASIKFQPVELLTQPLGIRLEEQLSSATNQEICGGACVEDEESAFEYVEAVLLASDLNWEEFLLRWISSEQILDPSLFHEVELFSNRSCHEQKLLFDCTNEVLTEVCECYFGYSPWVSFVKHDIRPIPRKKDIICEVWKGVEWQLLPQPSPCSLDQIVRKDMAKTGTWMDIRFDVEGIGTEIGDAIFEQLLEDTISSFVNEGPEIDSPVPRPVPIETE